MLLRLLALVLATLLGRSALVGSGGGGAPWNAGSRWESTQLAPAHPAPRLAVSHELPAAFSWRTVRPGPSPASAHSLPHALLSARAQASRLGRIATVIDGEVRGSATGALAFPYDATAPPRA